MSQGRFESAKQRWIWVVAPIVIAGAVGAGWSFSSNHPSSEFCELYGVLTDSPAVSYGDITLLVGEPIGRRDPCNGDDLSHYVAEDLVAVDGVLFDNCEISWAGGGRSTAAAEGIDCRPVTALRPAASDP